MQKHPATALLIIDMFSRFDFPGAAQLVPSAEAAASQIRRLRDRFDARRWPVIYANDNFRVEAGFPPAGGAVRAGWRPGRPDCHDAVSTADHYFVLKPKHSAFLASPLPILLAKLGVRRLWLSGMTADSCVLATALDANAREFEVRVAPEAVAGLPAAKRRAMALLANSGAAQVERFRMPARG